MYIHINKIQSETNEILHQYMIILPVTEFRNTTLHHHGISSGKKEKWKNNNK